MISACRVGRQGCGGHAAVLPRDHDDPDSLLSELLYSLCPARSGQALRLPTSPDRQRAECCGYSSSRPAQGTSPPAWGLHQRGFGGVWYSLTGAIEAIKRTLYNSVYRELRPRTALQWHWSILVGVVAYQLRRVVRCNFDQESCAMPATDTVRWFFPTRSDVVMLRLRGTSTTDRRLRISAVCGDALKRYVKSSSVRAKSQVGNRVPESGRFPVTLRMGACPRGPIAHEN